MLLKYVGPKPLITHTGIDFDNNKEDTYLYLNIIIQLIKNIQEAPHNNKTYHYAQTTLRISDLELLKELEIYCPKIQTLMDSNIKETEEGIVSKIQKVENNKQLTQENKKKNIHNIELMREYVIQRSINKLAYNCAIYTLVDLLKKDTISVIITPMFQTFSHILQSAQEELIAAKISADILLQIYQEDGKLLIRLEVKNT